MRQLVFSVKAAKALRKLPADIRDQIMDKLNRDADSGAGDVKAMQGAAGFRPRIGDYRELLRADDAYIHV